MKTGFILFFLLLLCSTALQAQTGNSSYFDLLDSTLHTIELPLAESRNDTPVVIKSVEEFNAYFKAYDTAKLPQVDFAKEYLQINYYCPWCSSYCNHSRGLCHRNACGRKPIWVTVKKQ